VLNKIFYYYENKIRYPPIGRKALYIKRLTPDIENAINSRLPIWVIFLMLIRGAGLCGEMDAGRIQLSA